MSFANHYRPQFKSISRQDMHHDAMERVRRISIMCPVRSITIHVVPSEEFWSKVAEYHLGRLKTRYKLRVRYLDGLKKVAETVPEVEDGGAGGGRKGFQSDIAKEEKWLEGRMESIGSWSAEGRQASEREKAVAFRDRYHGRRGSLKFEPGSLEPRDWNIKPDIGLWTPGGSLRLVECGIGMGGGPELR